MREKADGDLLAAFKRHLIAQALSPTTIVNYLADVRAFAFWYTRENGTLRAPLSLGIGHIRDYRAYLQTVEERAPSTINRRLQALRKFCRFACQAGWLDSNPAAQVSLLSESNNVSPRTLSSKEAERLFETLQVTQVQPSKRGGEARARRIKRDRAILHVLLYAGLKVKELVALRLSDVQLGPQGGSLVVRGRDGHVPRRVPLDTATCQALRQYLSACPSLRDEGHLFLSQRGTPISPRSVQRLVSGCARASGLEGVSTHTLRHTCAVALVEKTGDLATAAQVLGRRPETMAKYAGVVSSQ
jgi:site-specific recombinase XerD